MRQSETELLLSAGEKLLAACEADKSGTKVEEPARVHAADTSGPMGMLESLSLKIAQLEASTDELNSDSFGLLEQLETERLDFEMSRKRAQRSIDSYRELESQETQASVDK